MLRRISNWLMGRRQRQDAARHKKIEEIRRKVLAENSFDGSVTGRFQIITKEIIEATDLKKQATEAAQRVSWLAERIRLRGPRKK